MSNFLYRDSLYVVEGTTTQEHDAFKAKMREFLVMLSEKAKSNDKDIKLSIIADSPAVLELDGYENTHPTLNYAQVNIRSVFMGLNLLMKMNVLLRSGYHDYLNIDLSEQLSINEVEFSKNQDVDDVINFFANDYMSEDDFDEELLLINKQELAKRMNEMKMLSTEIFDHIGNSLGSRYIKIVEDSSGEFPYIKSDIKVSDAEILVISP